MGSVRGSRKGKGKTSPVAKKATGRTRSAVGKVRAAGASSKKANGRQGGNAVGKADGRPAARAGEGKVASRAAVTSSREAAVAATAAEPAPPPVERAPPPALPIPIASFTF